MFSTLRNRLRKAVSFRLTALYALFLIAGLAILLALFYFDLARTLQQSDRKILSLKLQEFRSEYQRSPSDFYQKMRRQKRVDGTIVRVVNSDKKTRFIDASKSLADKLQHSLETLPLQNNAHTEIAISDRQTFEIATTKLPGGNWLQIVKSSRPRHLLLSHFFRQCVIVLLPMILLCITAGAFLATRVLKPIRTLNNAVQSIIATGKVNVRLSPTKTISELGDLVNSFNQMLDRIERLIRGMEETLDNVAHDLRTPITRLRCTAELALQRPNEPKISSEALADCIEESERVVTLLNTLMDISEAASGSMRLNFKKITVSELLADILDLYQYVAEDKNVSISCDAPNNLTLVADENRVRQAVANLADNAIKYTSAKGCIRLRATSVNFANREEIAITVSDSGIGIPEAELPKVWDRLYRGDKSRSQRGLGLGLSMVKAILLAHEGRVAVKSRANTANSGSEFTLYFPVRSLDSEIS